jgi:hypothetical protein
MKQNAEMKFADWFQCFHKEKPKKPQMPSEDSQFTQKVSYEQSIVLYETEYAKWKSAINEQTNVSLFELSNGFRCKASSTDVAIVRCSRRS